MAGRHWAVDLDGMGADIHRPWLAALNERFGTSLTVGDIDDTDVSRFVPEEHRHEASFPLALPGFFLGLRPLPGFVDAMRGLVENEDEVSIVTAIPYSARSRTAANEKFDWCAEHLPFLPNGHRDVFVGSKKHHVDADGLLDDMPQNLTAYRRRRGPGVKLYSIAYPFNARVAGICDVRADGWADTAAAWATIMRHIKALPPR